MRKEPEIGQQGLLVDCHADLRSTISKKILEKMEKGNPIHKEQEEDSMREVESNKVSKRSGYIQKEKKKERISDEERTSIREKAYKERGRERVKE